MARLLAYLQPSQGVEAAHFIWQTSKQIVPHFLDVDFGGEGGGRLRDKLFNNNYIGDSVT
jgi:hypothetical protein